MDDKKNLSFSVKYTPDFTEDIFNKLIEFCNNTFPKDGKYIWRGWKNDRSYDDFKIAGYFVYFGKSELKTQVLFCGIDNNHQGRESISLDQLLTIIDFKKDVNLVVGNWYKLVTLDKKGGIPTYTNYIKYLSSIKDTIKATEYINILPYNRGYVNRIGYFSDIHSINPINPSEIQQYLPNLHPDKTITSLVKGKYYKCIYNNNPTDIYYFQFNKLVGNDLFNSGSRHISQSIWVYSDNCAWNYSDNSNFQEVTEDEAKGIIVNTTKEAFDAQNKIDNTTSLNKEEENLVGRWIKILVDNPWFSNTKLGEYYQIMENDTNNWRLNNRYIVNKNPGGNYEVMPVGWNSSLIIPSINKKVIDNIKDKAKGDLLYIQGVDPYHKNKQLTILDVFKPKRSTKMSYVSEKTQEPRQLSKIVRTKTI